MKDLIDKIFVIIFLIILALLVLYKINENQYDVNRDGKVNSKDMLDLRKYLINKE